ncbi:PfkB family carbohydrate kinase [Chitinivibrio alkaliphilus]|uniref:Ribokinase/pfkB superfamily n=1 Tax=Chitinivibrio alkaliphilus ACht1 TaxID=1313304 RepID=U7DC60_9BACT|nr:PfkB family carbohydrate kinase [Chitinivibrio alkaliphilus]ERP32005.1 ribokinase/pfkB superfamily [Chitinivibrio alkaliphilus ACht1]
MSQANIVSSAAERLKTSIAPKKIVAGFDGFVDEIIHVVKERIGDDDYLRMKTITEFSERTAAASGLSANIEFVPQQVKLGGNGPILANALLQQGYDVSYIGALGKDAIDPVYREFAQGCREVISLTDPGHTDALEFNDGKLMLVKQDNLKEVNWETLLAQAGEEKIRALCEESDFFALTNWTEIPQMNSLLEGFTNIFSAMEKRPGVFIDLSDPEKRTDADIRDVLDIFVKLQVHAEVILGLNENESAIIARLLDIDEVDLEKRGVAIRERLGLHLIVIHPIAGAAFASEQGSAWIDGPYTASPKLTTGAGDNFNSGFCNAWMAGLPHEECLAVGVCTSGYYVRACDSPNTEQLLDFMNRWAAVDCQEI